MKGESIMSFRTDFEDEVEPLLGEHELGGRRGVPHVGVLPTNAQRQCLGCWSFVLCLL